MITSSSFTTNNNCCNICSISTPNLPLITEINNQIDATAPIFKLKTCVPDIDWLNVFRICPECTANLQHAYIFREVCFKSEFLQFVKIEPETLKLKKNDDDSEVEDDNSRDLSISAAASDREQYNKGGRCRLKEVCNICSNASNRMYEISEIATDEMYSPIFKLQICVPDIDWLNYTFHICNLCKSNLDQAYDFRELCFKSEFMRKDIKIEKKIDATTTTNNNNNSTVISSFSTDTMMMIADDDDADSNITNPPQIRMRQRRGDNKCEYCGEMFKRKQLLIIHVRDIHPQKLLEINKSENKSNMCNFCGKSFYDASNLRVHLKIHLNKREYICEQCGQAFNTANVLDSHKTYMHTKRSDWKYACCYCKQVFPRQSGLTMHVKRHTNDKQFICHICMKSFNYQKNLKQHIRRHSNVYDFKCEHCTKEYKKKLSLQSHLAKQHGIVEVKVEQFACHLCAKVYDFQAALKRHLRVHWNDYKCEHCDEEYREKDAMLMHLADAHGIVVVEEEDDDEDVVTADGLIDTGLLEQRQRRRRRKFNCNLCANSYEDRWRLKRHYRSHSNVCDFKCEPCNKGYTRKETLIKHLKKVHGIDNIQNIQTSTGTTEVEQQQSSDCIPSTMNNNNNNDVASAATTFGSSHTCGRCGQHFDTKQLLFVHTRTVHKPVRALKFACDKCDQKYTTKTELYQHKRSHFKPYTCMDCGKSFSTANYLKMHSNIHLNKQQRCDSCTKSFITVNRLRMHILYVHTDPKEWHYTCKICIKRFPTQTSLTMHIKRHDNTTTNNDDDDEMIVCRLCGKEFLSKIELTEHQLVSHPNGNVVNTQFKCDYCTKTYKQRSLLEMHLKEMHDGDPLEIRKKRTKYQCTQCTKVYYNRSQFERHLHVQKHYGVDPLDLEEFNGDATESKDDDNQTNDDDCS